MYQHKFFTTSFIILYASLLFLAFLCIPAFAENSESRVFVPDRKVEKLAQEFDRKYYPLFIQALQDIKRNDTSLISSFYDMPKKGDDLIHIDQIEKLPHNFVFVYINPSDNKEYPLTYPIQWNSPEYSDPTWNLWFKSLRWLNPYLRSNNIDTLTFALKLINDYIITHTTYPDDRCRFIFGDHASSERLRILVMAYRSYSKHGIYERYFENRLLNAILSHIFLLASLENYASWNNHGIISDRALIEVISQLDEFKHKDKFIELAFSRVFEQYRYSFTVEGIHKEHSLCYHRGFALALQQIIQMAHRENISVSSYTKELKNRAYYFMRYVNVNKYDVPVGDCNRRDVFRQHDDPFNHGIRIFPSSGWAFIRDSILDISIITQSNFHSFAHYQEQETSFILNAGEHELIIDPGLLTYDRNSPFYQYMRSAHGHNVLIVDDKRFNSVLKNTGVPGITRYYYDANSIHSSNGVVEMTHPHYRNEGVEVYRQLAFAGNNTIIVIDILKSDSLRSYSQHFHLAPGANITENRDDLLIRWDEHPYYLKISSNAEDYSVVEGEMDPVKGWYFPAFNQAAPCPLLILKAKGYDTEIVTRIEVFKEGVNKKKLKTKRREIRNLFNGLETKEQRQLKHEPLPQEWRPNR